MHPIKLAAIAAAALLTSAATSRVPGNWTARTEVTPSGSHILGNPAAAHKLVEYISYTCNHCADFDREASDRLRLTMVQPGKLSVEVRHLVRDPLDMTAALLTNCGPPGKFFLNHTVFLRSQGRWMAAAGAASPAQQARWSTGNRTARFRAIASDLGFYAIMANRGYNRITVDRCLADEAMAKRLAEQTQEAVRSGVEGTPSFMLDGNLLTGTHNWAVLKVQLEALP